MAKERTLYKVNRPLFGKNRKLNHGEIVCKEQLKNLKYCLLKGYISEVDPPKSKPEPKEVKKEDSKPTAKKQELKKENADAKVSRLNKT